MDQGRPRASIGFRGLKLAIAGVSLVFRSWTRALASRAMPNPSRDPLRVADQFEHDFDLPAYEALFPEEQTDEWFDAVPPEQRVFVGGSYRSGGDRIYQIAEQVASCGLRPVIVGEFQRHGDETDRQKSFRILDLCGLATFDGTVQEKPGWWAEVERIVQTTKIPTLIAYYADRPSREYLTSALFPTRDDHPRLSVQPFGRTRDLHALIRSWLWSEHRGPLECEGDGTSVAGSGPLVIGSDEPTVVLEPSGTTYAR